jgi:hypothetical protein
LGNCIVETKLKFADGDQGRHLAYASVQGMEMYPQGTERRGGQKPCQSRTVIAMGSHENGRNPQWPGFVSILTSHEILDNPFNLSKP